MASRYPQIDPAKLKTSSIRDRASKVSVADFAAPHQPGASVNEFIDRLPNILAGRTVRTVIERISGARRAGKPVVVAMGAHVVKCGLSTVLIDLMRRGVITALAMNGAGIIHDAERLGQDTRPEFVQEGVLQAGQKGFQLRTVRERQARGQ